MLKKLLLWSLGIVYVKFQKHKGSISMSFAFLHCMSGLAMAQHILLLTPPLHKNSSPHPHKCFPFGERWFFLESWGLPL